MDDGGQELEADRDGPKALPKNLEVVGVPGLPCSQCSNPSPGVSKWRPEDKATSSGRQMMGQHHRPSSRILHNQNGQGGSPIYHLPCGRAGVLRLSMDALWADGHTHHLLQNGGDFLGWHDRYRAGELDG